MKTKKIIIFSSVAVLVIAALIIGFITYKNHQQKILIEDATAEITAFSEKISSEQDRNKKIELLTDFIEKSQEYEKQEKHLSEISEKCLDEISKVKTVFKEEYNQILAEHTLEDIENITDKAVLNSAITGLNALSELLQAENTITLTSDEQSEISEKINTLKNQYSTKIAEIDATEKAEEERLKKEAEEAAAKKAAERTKKNQNSSSENTSTNSNNSNENSSSNDNKSNNSSSVNSNGLTHGWSYDLETGEKVEGSDSYTDYSTGNVYDENGNYLGNLGEWATDW